MGKDREMKSHGNRKAKMQFAVIACSWLLLVLSVSDLNAASTYTITATTGIGGSISPSGAVSVKSRANKTFTITPNTGYHNANVTVDGVAQGAITSYTFSNVTASHNIAATFATGNAYTITVTAGSGGTVSPGTVAITHGGSQTFTIMPNTGYHIAKVTVDGVSQGMITSYTFTNVTATHTIAAAFAINTYTVTPSAGTGVIISPDTAQTVNYNATTAFTVTPNTGYSISSVTGCGGTLAGNTYTTGPITSNCTVTASFAINTFTITATAGSGGSISPSGIVTVNCGGSQTYTITPNNRYSIAGVAVDGVSQGAQTSITFVNVTANHTIAATFGTNSRTITISLDSPSKGATIKRPDVMVRGTVNNAGGDETGVTVNGVVANIYGNQFAANHVPLIGGTNTITAIAADINGGRSSDALTVNRALSGHYVSLTGTTESGVAPLVTTLQIDGSFSIANSSISVTGPVQPNFLSSSADTYQVQMTTEGIYYFTASVTGPDGNTYQDTIGVVVMDATAIDNLLRGKWNTMVNSLNNKDLSTALTYISPASRSIYQQMYTAIIDQLPAMVATQTGFNFISVNNNSAFYDLVTLENGVTSKYEVVFVRDTNGLWVIQDF